VSDKLKEKQVEISEMELTAFIVSKPTAIILFFIPDGIVDVNK
jgi:hypothetical protein